VLTPVRLRRSAFLLLCLALTGCGSDDKPVAPGPPSYSMSVAPPSAVTTLGTAVMFTAYLASTNFAGPVTLSVVGAPASWQVAISPSATVTLSNGGTGSATVTITIPSNGEARPAGQTVTIHATASPGDKDVAPAVTVANEYIIPIANGTGIGAHWGALAGTTINLASGVILTFRNDDSIGHRIHATGTIPGLAHQSVTMGPGGVYSDTLGVGVDSDVYCHDHGTGTGLLTINVQ